MKTAVLKPVVFTDGGVGPSAPDELHAPYFPAVEEHLLEHDLGTWPAAAWVTFLDNIPDLKAIHNVDVTGWDDTSILLRVSAQPNQVGRVRIQINLLSE